MDFFNKGEKNKGVKGYIMAAIASFLIQLMLYVVIIVAILAPFSMAYMILTEKWDEWVRDGSLKLSTNVQVSMTKWFTLDTQTDGGTSTEAQAVSKKYEEYLLKRFMQLNDDIVDGDDSGEINDKKNVAVNWVYGKVYSSYFEIKLGGKILHHMGFLDDAPLTYEFKDLAYTAQNIYTPKKKITVAEARKSKGDSINVYDLMGFDYVAGSLFDMLNIDLLDARNQVYLENKDVVDTEIGDKVRYIYKDGVVDILKEIEKSATKLLSDGANTPTALLKAKGISVISPKGNNGLEKLVSILKANGFNPETSDTTELLTTILMSENLSSGNYSAIAEKMISKFEADNKAIVDKQKAEDVEAKKNWDKKQDELEAKFKEENPDKEYSREAFKPRYYKANFDAQREALEYVSNAKDVLLGATGGYLSKYSQDWDSKNPGAKSLTELVNESILTIKSTAIKDINEVASKALEKGSKEKAKLTDKIVDTKLKSLLSEKIQALKLARTQMAAQSYRDALTATKEIAVIEYHILNTASFKELDWFRKQKIFNNLSISYADGKYTAKLDTDASSDYGKHIYNKVGKDMILDNDGRPVVSGVDVATKVNYMEGKAEMYFKLVREVIGEAENSLNGMKFHKENIAFNNTVVEKMKTETLKGSAFSFSLVSVNNLMNTSNIPQATKDIINGVRSELNNGGTSNIRAFVKKFKDGSYKVTASDVQGGVSAVDAVSWNNSFASTATHFEKYLNIVDAMNQVKSSGCYTSSAISDIANSINSVIKVELDKLVALREDINLREKAPLTGDMISPADLNNIRIDGLGQDSTDKFYDGNKLLVKDFMNTQEEAVKIVARQQYSDILTMYRQQSGGGTGAAVSIGDMEIGTWTVPGAQNYGSYERAARFLDITKRVCAENNMDPYLITAMIATESGGNMGSNNGAAVGLTQIEHVHWNKTVTLPSGEQIYLDPQRLLRDPELAIKAGVWQTNARAEEFHGNILVSIGGYNFGAWGVRRVILHHLDSIGVASLADWTSPGRYPSSVSGPINDYIKSMDAGWLASRDWYSNQGGHTFFPGAGPGTATHIDKVLKYYNTVDGMPWVYNKETGGKVYLTQGDASLGEDESGNKLYHNTQKELVLWKEFYTDTKVFEASTEWAKENNPSLILQKDYTSTIIESIEKAVSDKDTEKLIIGLGYNKSTMENLLAGAINLDNGFKIPAKTFKDIEKYASTVLSSMLESIKANDGKDKYFSIYHYASPDKAIASYDIMYAPNDFKEFFDEKNKQDATTTDDTSATFKKVAQIISGNLDINVSDFYKKADRPSGTASLSPENRFYKEWLDAKSVLHEIYNVMTDDRDANGKRIYGDELPIPKPSGELDENGKPKDKELLGTINIQNKNGYPANLDVPLRDKPLENNIDKEASRKQDEIKYIVIHESDLTTNELHRKYNAKEQKDSMHYVVDSTTAYRFAEESYIANHLSDRTNAHTSVQTNSNSIGIEISKVALGSKERTLWNTVAITKHLMAKYNIPADNVVLHKDVTGNDCTPFMADISKVEGKTNWQVFKEALKDPSVIIEYKGNSASGSGKFIRPSKGVLTSPYGPRVHPISGKNSFHTGIDLADPSGPPIVASDGGVVIKKSSAGGYGNHVVIDHGSGLTSLYAHMKSTDVSVGDSLEQGEQVGIMGTTGNSTGVHLHFEIRENDIHTNPLSHITL